jgi:hypothetical protein
MIGLKVQDMAKNKEGEFLSTKARKSKKERRIDA